MLRFRAPFILGLLLSLFALGGTASPAAAQGWLADRQASEGAGIRVGNLELHPGIGAEVGWDSNIFNSSGDTPEDQTVSSAIMRVTPHLSLSTLGTQRQEGDDDEDDEQQSVDFRLSLAAPIYIYFADEADSNVGTDANISVTFNPQGRVAFMLSDNFSRTVRPFSEEGASSYARDRNDASAGLAFQSRGGIFRATTRYTLGLDLFESNSFSYSNNIEHRAELGFSWRFLPQTAVFYDFRSETTDYLDTAGSAVGLSNNTRLRSRIGLNGVISQRISALVAVGYGAAFVKDAAFAEKDTVVAQAELRIRPSPTTRIHFGYDRDLYGSFSGGYYSRDRGYAGLQLLMGGSFLLGIDASVAFLDFGSVLDATGAPLGAGGESTRTDVLAQASLFGEYRATDWLGINATLTYTGDFTDFQFSRMVDTATVVDPADYQKIGVWLGVRAFY